MSRLALLEGLLAHNRERGLSTAIWGEGAAEAASQAVEAHPFSASGGATAYRLDTPLDLGYSIRCDTPERLHFPVHGGSCGRETSPLTLEVALLKNACVRWWHGYHLVLQGEAVVADASSAYWPLSGGALASRGVAAMQAGDQSADLPEAFLVCDDLDMTNFCHFICDLLPKIALAQECSRRTPIVIEAPTQPFQRELLEMVQHKHGHPLVPLEMGVELRVHRLFYLRRTGHTHPLLRCSGLAMQWVRGLVDAKPQQAPEGSILYLGRRGRRVITNEAEVIAALQELSGSVTVECELERLGVRQQTERLLQHQTVVGPHGAGFTHLVFAHQAPTRAVEIMGEGNGSLTFALISGRLGLDHNISVAKATASQQGPNFPNLEANVESVMSLVSAPLKG